jgi:hypothetical protein
MGRQDGQESWTQVGESDHRRRPSPTPAQGRPVVVGNIASVRVAPGSRDRRISPPPGGANPDQYSTLLTPRTAVKVWVPWLCGLFRFL